MQKGAGTISYKRLLFAFLLGAFTTLCRNAYAESYLFYGNLTGILFELVETCFYMALIYFLVPALPGLIRLQKRGPLPGRLLRLDFHDRDWKVTAGLLLVCWLPYLILFFPGLANYDTVNQVNDVFNGVSSVPFGFVEGQEKVTAFLNDHHPFLVSLLFAGFVKVGMVLGSANLGLFLYCILQMAFGAFVFARLICALESFGVGYFWRKGAFLFYALMPFVPFFMINMLKNSLHGLLYVLYFLHYFRMVRKGAGKKDLAVLLLLSLVLCLTQKTGLYLVLLSNAALFLKKELRRRWKGILLAILLPLLVMMILLPRILFPVLHIYPGGRQEMLGTLFQQTARVVRDHEADLSPEDMEVIDQVLVYDKIKEDFDPHSTDNVKATYRLSASAKDLQAYYGLWIRQAFRYPLTYLRATLSVCGGYFAPSMAVNIHEAIPAADGAFSSIHHVLSEDWRGIAVSFYQLLCSLPGADLLMQLVLYVWWLPLISFYLWIRFGRRGDGILFIPVLISILFLVVSPMIYGRYALGLLLTAPILPALVTTHGKGNA